MPKDALLAATPSGGSAIRRTMDCGLDDAEICRRNGWAAGIWLVGRERGRLELIEITAVGRDDVLAVWWPGGEEGLTSLTCRNWRVATDAERAALGPAHAPDGAGASNDKEREGK